MSFKKSILLLLLALITVSVTTVAKDNKKSVEVLYFKANLACCKARACNALQADVDSVLKKYFANENIELKVIRLTDEVNKDLVAKYNAKSQTVVIVTRKGKNETATDVSVIVQEYVKDRNREKFEEEMIKHINQALKK